MMVDTKMLRKTIEDRDMNVADVASLIGLDKATLYRRFSDAESFTIGEVQRIKTALNLTPDEAVSIFFTSAVA